MKRKNIVVYLRQCVFVITLLHSFLQLSWAEQEIVIGEYTFRHTFSGKETLSEGIVEIFHRDKRVYQRYLIADYPVSISVEGGMARDANGELYPLPLGSDLTGDGIPDVALLEAEPYNRDVICYMTLFEIGECFRQIATFSDCGDLEDVDGDGLFEVNLRDDAFSFWENDWGNGPTPPTVILRYDPPQDKYALAEELMYRSAPTEEMLQVSIANIRKAENEYAKDAPPLILWEKMLDLIYSGHEDVAWRVYDEAWQPRFGDKAKWAEDFKAQLAESKYWKHLYPIQFRDSLDIGYPELLQRPSYPPGKELPAETVFEAQCGSYVTCDLETCRASINEMFPDELIYYPTDKETPIHVVIMLIDQKQPKLYNLFGKYGDSYPDAQCDIGTPVFIIHKSSRKKAE